MEDREEVTPAMDDAERRRIAELERFLRLDALPAAKAERLRQVLSE